MDTSIISAILLYAVPVLYAIALHEAAHGYAARYFGDRTAEAQGRLTLNPLKHIDPVGTILVPGALLVMALVSGGLGEARSGRGEESAQPTPRYGDRCGRRSHLELIHGNNVGTDHCHRRGDRHRLSGG